MTADWSSAVSKRYNGNELSIDTTVFNPARIDKLPGTMCCKGDDTPERPHRMANIIDAPAVVEVVPVELLEALAKDAPDPTAAQASGNGQAASGRGSFPLEAWIAERYPDARQKRTSDGEVWVLPVCPWDASHTGGCAHISRRTNGVIGAGCKHNSCAGKGWREMRDAVEPGWREKRQQSQQESDGDWQPMLVRLSDVKPVPVRWLWPGRIALGKVTIVAGDPGLGKSLVTLNLAANVSKGRAWPDGSGDAPLGSVIIVTAEDELDDTVRPRLDELGANVDRVTALEGVELHEKGKSPTQRSFDLENDLPRLRKAMMRTPECKLVIVDPVSAFFGAKTDSHKDAHVRALLAPLSKLAAEFGVAVVVVSHLNKAEGRSAIQRMTGSGAFVAAARAAWLVVRDPANAKRRLFLPIKNNSGNDESGLAFYVTSEHSDNGQPVVEWTSERVTMTADEALAASRKPTGGALGKAVEWLKEALASGPVAQADLEKNAAEAGITVGTLLRAKKELHVASRKDKSFGEGSRWLWSLPVSTENQPSAVGEPNEGAQDSEEAQLRPVDDLRSLGESDDAERLKLLDEAEAAVNDAELAEYDLPDADDGNWQEDDIDRANDALDEAAAE